MISKTVTVGDRVLLVRTPDDIVELRVRGERRTFSAPSAADIVVTETKGMAWSGASSWSTTGIADRTPLPAGAVA